MLITYQTCSPHFSSMFVNANRYAMNQTLTSAYRPNARFLSAALVVLALQFSSVPAHARDANAGSLEVVERYLAAWNSDSADELSKVVDAQVEYFNTSNAAPHRGIQSILEVSHFLSKLLPNRKLVLRSRPVVEKDTVAIEWEFSAIQVTMNGSGERSERPIKFQGASIFRVNQGKITYASDYYNSASMREQLEP
ncbi:nuclear transport factor 2 family protein [Cupriavidus metallidurans]|uniref:Nuclear transport factor 2 family protein n=1 Tax=Cupriavidus metallidurans TaxID=119219 RepID=A0A482IZ91_9BURK|nr:nuclear transport factor 2 family protein [Cupriavidus metallidurans]QBP12529.1 nuclear transport factor 2 family protein [Cupriavidus metallidurans]